MEGKVQGKKCWVDENHVGIPFSGSRWICPICDVVWFPIPVETHKLNSTIVYRGVVIPVVDFSDPMAPSSPA